MFRLTSKNVSRLLLLAVLASLLSACIYRPNIRQGNRLEEENLDLVQVGMSRSAVQFLLGTPMIGDPFHQERWDYPYYYRIGRSDDIERRWVAIFFQGDQVSRIETDLQLDPQMD